jgi:hypothetical protein
MKAKKIVLGYHEWRAVAVEVLADVLRTVVTFLPIKALLVAAIGQVPAFIPQILAEFGSLVVSLVLMVFAVVAALIVASLSSWQRKWSPSAKRTPDFRQEGSLISATMAQLGSGVKRYSRIVLFVLYVGVGVIASPTQAIATLFGGLVAYFGLSKRVPNPFANSHQKPPTTRIIPEVWRTSSTWVAVGAGFVAIFLHDVSNGLTPILIGVVVGRQALIVGKQLFGVNTNPGEERKGAKDSPLPAMIQMLGDPRAFSSLFGESVTHLASHESATPKTLTLSGKRPEADEFFILRIYQTKDWARLEEEVSLLSNLSARSPNPLPKLSEFKRAGLIGLRQEWPEIGLVGSDGDVSREELVSWYSDFEQHQISSDERQAALGQIWKPLDSLAARSAIESIIHLPGKHQEPLGKVLAVWQRCASIIGRGPLTVGFEGGAQGSRLLKTLSGGIFLVDGGDWQVAPLGQNWPRDMCSSKLLSESHMNFGVSQSDVDEASIRHVFHMVLRQIKFRKFSGLTVLSHRLVRGLEKVS